MLRVDKDFRFLTSVVFTTWVAAGGTIYKRYQPYVSVTSPTQEAVLFQAAERPGAAIEARKRAKNRAHFDQCRSQGIFFQPLVVETFGGWCADALPFLKELGRQDARRWGKDPALEIKYFFQRLSVALQRGNAALLIDRDVEPV